LDKKLAIEALSSATKANKQQQQKVTGELKISFLFCSYPFLYICFDFATAAV
jgi:hypothetical protein